MAKDIKLYKDGHEVTINETQLDNFLELGYKQEKDKQVKSKKKEEQNLFGKFSDIKVLV